MNRWSTILSAVCTLALAACGSTAEGTDSAPDATETVATSDAASDAETEQRDPCKGGSGTCGWSGDVYCPCPEGTHCTGPFNTPDPPQVGSPPYGSCVSAPAICDGGVFHPTIACGFAWPVDAELGEPPYCGDCPDGHVCVVDYSYAWMNYCCELRCADSALGPPCGGDGCGGSCGECDEGLACGAIQEGFDIQQVCMATCSTWCAQKGFVCGDHAASGTPDATDGKCACGKCPTGDFCMEDGTCCTPDCEDKECGDNGCKGSCGTCGEGVACLENMGGPPICVDAVTAACSLVECGVGWWGECDDRGCWDIWPWCPCSEGEVCVEAGTEVVLPECCMDEVQGTCVTASEVCGNGTCDAEEAGESCSSCPADCGCPDGFECAGQECVCVPDCTGKKCGDDGCGGGCGQCDDGNPCTEDVCMAGKTCFSTPLPDNAPCSEDDSPWMSHICMGGTCCGTWDMCFDGECNCLGWPMYGGCLSECEMLTDDTDWEAQCIWACGGNCCNSDADCPADKPRCAQLPIAISVGMSPAGRCVEEAAYPACWWSQECPQGEICSGGPNAQQCPYCNAPCPGLEPGLCVPAKTCGNGVAELAWGEACDDGNTLDGDGCDNSCQIEPGCAKCVCKECNYWGCCMMDLIHCDGDGIDCTCAIPEKEACNGIDDNCDGLMDEGCD